MKKTKLLIGSFSFLIIAGFFAVFGFSPAKAATVNEIDTVQTERYMYMSEPNEGAIYVFDNQNGGAFVKKLSVCDYACKPLNMLVYRSKTVTAENYILVTQTDGNFISIIKENGPAGAGPEYVGFIQTSKRPYDLDIIDDYLVYTVVKNSSSPTDYYPVAIKLNENNGQPQREPGTADIDWLSHEDEFGNSYPQGNEKISVAPPNDQVMIFGVNPSYIAFISFIVTDGVPSNMSSPGENEYAYPYNDFVFDHDWWRAYYVGNEGADSGKIQVVEVGANDKLYEWEVPNGANANALAFSRYGELYVGMKPSSASDIDVVKYGLQYDPVTDIPSENIETRYELGSSGPLLDNGISSEMNNNVEAVYAITEDFVYWLYDDGSYKKLYDFANESIPGGVTGEDPDLVVSDISFSSAGNLAGERGTLTVTIRNQGGSFTDGSLDIFYAHNYPPNFAGFDPSSNVVLGASLPGTSDPFERGEEMELSWEGVFGATGNYDLSYTVDYLDMLAESDESNNELTETITIGDPDETVVENLSDLEVVDISFTHNDPASTYLVDQAGNLTVTIRNSGAALTNSEGLKYWREDADFGSFATGDSLSPSRALPSPNAPLGTGEEIEFSWQGSFKDLGRHILTYTVDSKNLLSEQNENNNTREREFNVTEPGTVVELPDLAFSAVKKTEGPGGETFLEIYYKNIGEATVYPSEYAISADLMISGIEEPLGNIPMTINDDNNHIGKAIKADNGLDISHLTPGVHLIKFRLDTLGDVIESDENNNVYTKRVYIPEPEADATTAEGRQRIEDMRQAARDLINDNIGIVLDQIGELRDSIRENNAKLKYLNKLSASIDILTSRMQKAINSFVAYGVDNNTKALGEGERAAVIYSYKAAYNKLPETEEELADAIKIANGRWPSRVNEEAEERAKEEFMDIYKRIPDMDDPQDNAAVTVMAYGLRQPAENRNLDSEKKGIEIFRGIYGYHPRTTEDWNMMQAITYSGASRGVDSDGDFLVDQREAELGTDPNLRDTDGDGYIDGIEVANGYDPLRAQ